ncbi:UNVERIFIED_CONTAM: hypothetical protein Scaly_2237900 [Sesamum calycinum]|uniref:Reverse transcriptase/retrotransposon-derived protein RNase H-like domain-containing protein n=1 Tax=Sesamum calycinum TaxID=2727403 RepID=A0AAW2MAQ7_9LAMI
MIDATMGHEALSFMDRSSGYNQIHMAPKDEELTTFRTPKGIYCYKVMPFGLKNAGATYQRAMQRYLMICFTKMLSATLISIKSYLMKPPMLVAPVPRRRLILYIATQECSVGALLAQENDEGKESALYYLSRMMTPNELKYSPIEKIFSAHLRNPKIKAPLPNTYYTACLQSKSTKKAVKGQVLEDFLVVHPIFTECELSNDLPDENIIVIEKLIGWLGDVEIEHVLRKDNKQADALAKLASTLTTLEDNAHARYVRVG